MATMRAMIIAGASRHTSARVLVEIDSGMNGYEIVRSKRENARSLGWTKFRPPPAAAMALLYRVSLFFIATLRL